MDADLAAAADAYDAVGSAWSAAAHAALPDDAPELGRLRSLIDEAYATYHASGADAADELGQIREARRAVVAEGFPRSHDGSRQLVEALADRVDDLAKRERDALDLLAGVTRMT